MSHHRIAAGETLSQLAARYGTTVQALAQANGIQNVDLIIAGAELKLPGHDRMSTQSVSMSGDMGSAGGPSGLGAVGSSSSAAQHLASVAQSVASSRNTTGECAKGVFDALQQAGMAIPRSGSAYMAADTLASDPRFREVQLTDEEIRNLPAGAIIVSGPYNMAGNPHGHIAVSLGNGMEASDHIQQIATGGTQRVFIPV